MESEKTTPSALRLRCCDAIVAALGLVIIVSSAFHTEITWFFATH